MSHSEQRRRDHFRGLRLYAEEDKQLQAVADELGTTVPELVRAVMFNRPIKPGRPQCSAKHGARCTQQHKDLVDGYRDQRYREQLALEEATVNHQGDIELWRANGGKLTTFAEWLKAHRISSDEERQRGKAN